MARRLSALIALVAAVVGSAPAQQVGRHPRTGPQWRGPHANGVSLDRQSSARVERDEEHPLEGGDSRPRILVARRLGRSHLRDHGRSRRRHRRRAARPARRTASRAACTASSSWRSIARPARRSGSASPREQEPHEAGHFDNGTWASGSPITDGQTRLRLLRVVRPVRVRHERQAALGEGPRRQADAQPVRRGLHARRSTATLSSSSGIT